MMRRGMKRAFEGRTTWMMPYKMMRRPVSIKAGGDHIRAFKKCARRALTPSSSRP
jgi:hypothetical protein